MSLSISERMRTEIQRAVSHCLFVFFCPLIVFLIRHKYKFQVDNLKEMRKRYKLLVGSADGPVLICSNHLTLIDSIIQSAMLNSTFGYLINFSLLPWNLPEKKNFNHKLHWKIICYLGKCIPVQRLAPPSVAKKSVSKMMYVLNKGDVLSIFPEGKRSRTGLVDDEDFSYGVGQLLKELPKAKVLCLYMRGKKNGCFADFPDRGEHFYLDMDLISPTSELKGMRKVRDLSTQVIHKLKNMEQEYFAHAVVRGE